MSEDAYILTVVMFAVVLIVVPAILLDYKVKSLRARAASPGDQRAVQDLWQTAQRMETRIGLSGNSAGHRSARLAQQERHAMNATMTEIFHRPRLVRGVCAELAARAGVAVWLPRAAFLVFAALHWFLAIVLYIVLAKTLCAARPGPRAATWTTGPALSGVRDRFGALDARLADLEAASLREEAGLRRAFRDLEDAPRAPAFK